MRTIHLSATEARNNFFQLLNQVIYEGVQVVVEKAGTKRNVRFIAEATEKEKDEDRMKALKETFGIWKDIPESHFSDDRLHGKKAKAFLDKLRSGDA